MQYAFVLGREPAISTAELIAALNAADAGFDAKTSVFTPAVMIATVEKQLDADFFHRLGGSIKMARDMGLIAYGSPTRSSPIATGSAEETRSVLREAWAYMLYLFARE